MHKILKQNRGTKNTILSICKCKIIFLNNSGEESKYNMKMHLILVKTHLLIEHCNLYFKRAIFMEALGTITRIWKQPKCPMTGEGIKK